MFHKDENLLRSASYSTVFGVSNSTTSEEIWEYKFVTKYLPLEEAFIEYKLYTFLEDVCVLLLVNFVKERGEGISLVNKSVRWWKCDFHLFFCHCQRQEWWPFPNNAIEERVETVVGASKNPPNICFCCKPACLFLCF